MSWRGRRVLVTGGGGFIGSHLVERLVAEGAQTRVFLRYTSRPGPGYLALATPEMRAALDLCYGDLGDAAALRAAMAGCDTVFHLGALIAIPYSYQRPVDVTRVNVLGTQNVLEAARDLGLARVVHTSTSEVYGTARYAPIDEAHPLNAQSPYSASKIAADALAASYHMAFDLPVATIRPFNTYGPRQSGRAVIPTIIGQALRSDRIELGSLSPTRDLTFVEDTVDGFLRVGLADEAVGRVTNVGSGTEISIGDLARMVLEIVGRDLPIVESAARVRPAKSEVMRLVCDARLARETLGWRPRVDLHEGLSRVVEFIRARPDWVDPNRYEV